MYTYIYCKNSNRKANDKDVLETNSDQLDNRYHRDKLR